MNPTEVREYQAALRQARAEYQAQRRKNPAIRERERQSVLAQQRARQRIIDAHRTEYQDYYAEELGLIRGPTQP